MYSDNNADLIVETMLGAEEVDRKKYVKFNDPPIFRLPTELLHLIFTCTVLEDGNKTITVTHVCRQWRQIALSSPGLWTSVSLLRGSWPRVFIERSGSHDLEVDIALDTVSRLDELLALLVANIQRLKVLTFMFSESDEEKVTSLPMLASMLGQMHHVRAPVLEVLELPYDDDYYFHPPVSYPVQDDIFLIAPRLRKFRTTCEFPVTPSLTLLSNLREFSLHMVPAMVFWSILCHTPQLETFDATLDDYVYTYPQKNIMTEEELRSHPPSLPNLISICSLNTHGMSELEHFFVYLKDLPRCLKYHLKIETEIHPFQEITMDNLGRLIHRVNEASVLNCLYIHAALCTDNSDSWTLEGIRGSRDEADPDVPVSYEFSSNGNDDDFRPLDFLGRILSVASIGKNITSLEIMVGFVNSTFAIEAGDVKEQQTAHYSDPTRWRLILSHLPHVTKLIIHDILLWCWRALSPEINNAESPSRYQTPPSLPELKTVVLACNPEYCTRNTAALQYYAQYVPGGAIQWIHKVLQGRYEAGYKLDKLILKKVKCAEQDVEIMRNYVQEIEIQVEASVRGRG